MKKLLLCFLISAIGTAAFCQSKPNENTLLWRISGNGLAKPSYLFGTIHMLCADDVQLSDSLQRAIEKSDDVYLELDMDNLMEMMGALTKMKMRNDTTLSDLLTEEEYRKVKSFFQAKGGLLPFSVLEKYKPFLAASTLMEGSLSCKKPVAMEQLIMKKAASANKSIKGLETMAYQLSIFDSIPYGIQAKQLVKMVEDAGNTSDTTDTFGEMTNAYRNQQLDKLEEIIRKEDVGISNFTNLLLYNRNENWAKKLKGLMAQKSLVIAVGAGHLPGNQGVINLLRKAGYKVEPVENKMIKSNLKEI